jgi:hypothetical protein
MRQPSGKGSEQAHLEIILRQAGALEQLQKKLAELEEQVKNSNDRHDGLAAKVAELEKKAARPAAPFRIDEKHRVLERKRPGRAQGHPGSSRAIPDDVDEEIFVSLPGCPQCGGEVGPRPSPRWRGARG